MKYHSPSAQQEPRRYQRFRIIHLLAVMTFICVYLGVEMTLERVYFGRPVWVFLPLLVLPAFWATIFFLIWGKQAAWIGATLGFFAAAIFASDAIAVLHSNP